MSTPFDVVAVGNAIVDIQLPVQPDFLVRHAITPAAMTLIDAERADALTLAFEGAVEAAGGSAANSMTGIASLGGRAAYVGKVQDDRLGHAFTRAFRAAGVAFDTPPAAEGPGTARCLIAITPDGQRAMSTFLGVSTLLEPADVDRDTIQSGAIVFLEGYLFDRPEAKAAFVRAAEFAAAAGRRTALTLSDTFCVERHRESFRHLVRHHVDVLFANEAEILSLYQVSDLADALGAAEAECAVVAVTRSEHGSVVLADGQRHAVPAFPVERVVDTTGAGDLYAAGFLHGLTSGRSVAEAGRLGSLAAAEVISHLGPRPQVSLAGLARAHGL